MEFKKALRENKKYEDFQTKSSKQLSKLSVLNRKTVIRCLTNELKICFWIITLCHTSESDHECKEDVDVRQRAPPSLFLQS